MISSASQSPQWPQLWAKTRSDKTSHSRTHCRYQPLLYHMLDVAAVAGLVWDHCLIPRLRKRLEDSLGTDARTEIVFLSGRTIWAKPAPASRRTRRKCQNYHSTLGFNSPTTTRTVLMGSLVHMS